MRICNTCPDGASYDGSIHQLMNRGPSTIRNRPDMIVRDKATFDQPLQYAVGVDHVLVNGVPVIRNGEHTGAKPGRVVRGPGFSGS